MQKLGEIGALAALLCLTAWVSPAWAQDDEATTAAARALFEQGMDAVDAGDYETAADRLDRSLALRDSIVVRVNLALALGELGRLVEASEHLRRVQREAEEGSPPHRVAGERLALITPRVGRLRIDVAGATAGVTVRLDGNDVPEALLGVPQPADPGAHVVSLHRGGQALVTREVEVAAGGRASVSLEAPPPTAEEVAEAQAQDSIAADPIQGDGGGVEQEWWFWTLIGLVAVGAGVGIGVGVWAATEGPPQPDLVGTDGRFHLTLLEAP
ncbi:MAG: hypothetical protein VYE22_32150 [Myxococcota bacterium]|nr:hypothetical protein [Myxococcota bacterium]